MKAEIIAVGTELLLGQIVNTNAQYLSQQCASLGIDVYFQTVVGDNEERLRQALDTAKNRADFIICTGGLGPTKDDLTKDVLAAYVGQKLVMHEPSLEKIESMFQQRGQEMAESNARQALMLEGSDPLNNDNGLAVGVALSHEGVHYMLLPGPPREMKLMFDTYGTEWISRMTTGGGGLHSKMLKFAGIGESSLEKELLDLIESQQDPTIAPYAKEGEVTIRLTTRAESQEEAGSRFGPVEDEIRRRLGSYLYATEDKPIEQVIYELLKEQGLTLSAAESCTGGLIGDLITSVPDSSTVFKGGVVSYTNEVKQSVLKVPARLLEGPDAPGAVSQETAEQMACSVLELMDTDYALSVTGYAGPGAPEGQLGLVFIGLAERGKPVEVIKARYSGNREMIKLRAAKTAFYQLWKKLRS
ncbi:competence/damage-inducible protein A [Paenibacillus sp. J2TS4]|uniref:competence/damage-inducible protein A n=1 Tax=Paenibacillus sp. J2TS4 TaxID=2807194 RepID=UPI001B071FB1|nr:competence/damage-inducible protein A [Paenibacillus sp. J2TS4]GIP33143.1 putative competence-damage inducible protein [Paenibacillus sp. J2TS4]